MASTVLLIGAHQAFSKSSNQISQTLFSKNISYSQLQEEVNSSINVQAYMLCEINSDCNYVTFSLLKPILNKYQLQQFSSITFVNMDDVIRQVSSTRLKELYGVQSLPALVLLDTSTSTVISVLEYYKSSPLTQDMIEEWLITHQLLR